MIARYVYRGEAIDYTPDADVAAGSVVVIGSLIGIAKLDIKAGTLGALALVGVYDIVKATGEGTVIARGARVYWDTAAQKATTVSTGNTYLGEVIVAASATEATVRVRLGGWPVPVETETPEPEDAIVSLVDNSGGTAADTIVEITDVATAADGIASNTAKINAILTVLRNFGIIAAS